MRKQSRRRRTAAVAGLGAIALGAAALAVCPPAQFWSFDETTEGEDVYWTSPTAVANNMPRYAGTYEIVQVKAGIMWQGIDFGEIDVTGFIPPENLTGSEVLDGPPPVVLVNDYLVYPEPPEAPSMAAHVYMEVDAAGYGQLAVTEVVLGTLIVDLGWPFGEQEVDITSVRLVGNLDVQPIGPRADVTGDCVVGIDDLVEVINHWGACADPADCPWDCEATPDGMVGINDLVAVINAWGNYPPD